MSRAPSSKRGRGKRAAADDDDDDDDDDASSSSLGMSSSSDDAGDASDDVVADPAVVRLGKGSRPVQRRSTRSVTLPQDLVPGLTHDPYFDDEDDLDEGHFLSDAGEESEADDDVDDDDELGEAGANGGKGLESGTDSDSDEGVSEAARWTRKINAAHNKDAWAGLTRLSAGDGGLLGGRGSGDDDDDDSDTDGADGNGGDNGGEGERRKRGGKRGRRSSSSRRGRRAGKGGREVQGSGSDEGSGSDWSHGRAGGESAESGSDGDSGVEERRDGDQIKSSAAARRRYFAARHGFCIVSPLPTAPQGYRAVGTEARAAGSAPAATSTAEAGTSRPLLDSRSGFVSTFPGESADMIALRAAVFRLARRGLEADATSKGAAGLAGTVREVGRFLRTGVARVATERRARPDTGLVEAWQAHARSVALGVAGVAGAAGRAPAVKVAGGAASLEFAPLAEATALSSPVAAEPLAVLAQSIAVVTTGLDAGDRGAFFSMLADDLTPRAAEDQARAGRPARSLLSRGESAALSSSPAGGVASGIEGMRVVQVTLSPPELGSLDSALRHVLATAIAEAPPPLSALRVVRHLAGPSRGRPNEWLRDMKQLLAEARSKAEAEAVAAASRAGSSSGRGAAPISIDVAAGVYGQDAEEGEDEAVAAAPEPKDNEAKMTDDEPAKDEAAPASSQPKRRGRGARRDTSGPLFREPSVLTLGAFPAAVLRGAAERAQDRYSGMLRGRAVDSAELLRLWHDEHVIANALIRALGPAPGCPPLSRSSGVPCLLLVVENSSVVNSSVVSDLVHLFSMPWVRVGAPGEYWRQFQPEVTVTPSMLLPELADNGGDDPTLAPPAVLTACAALNADLERLCEVVRKAAHPVPSIALIGTTLRASDVHGASACVYLDQYCVDFTCVFANVELVVTLSLPPPSCHLSSLSARGRGEQGLHALVLHPRHACFRVSVSARPLRRARAERFARGARGAGALPEAAHGLPLCTRGAALAAPPRARSRRRMYACPSPGHRRRRPPLPLLALGPHVPRPAPDPAVARRRPSPPPSSSCLPSGSQDQGQGRGC